jgi:hypothetical protein
MRTLSQKIGIKHIKQKMLKKNDHKCINVYIYKSGTNVPVQVLQEKMEGHH